VSGDTALLLLPRPFRRAPYVAPRSEVQRAAAERLVRAAQDGGLVGQHPGRAEAGVSWAALTVVQT